MYHITNVASDASFWKIYFSQDLAMLMTTVSSAQGDLNFQYSFASAVQTKPLLFEITTDRVNLYDATDTGKQQPTTAAFAKDHAVTVTGGEAVQPLYFELQKNAQALNVVFTFDKSSLAQCIKPQALPDPSTITFSFQNDIQTDSLTIRSSSQSITGRLAGLGVSNDRLNVSSSSIALSFEQSPDDTFRIYSSDQGREQNKYLSCILEQQLNRAMPALLTKSQIKTIDATDRAESSMDSFFQGNGMKLFIRIPASFTDAPSLQKIASAAYLTLEPLVAVRTPGAS